MAVFKFKALNPQGSQVEGQQVAEDRKAAFEKIRARGPVMLCLMDGGLPGEVEVSLGDDFPVTPQIKGALKSLGGVVTVEDML